MLPYISEFVGTALLILIGNGVCANVNLSKSGFKAAGPVFITIGWGLAVMIPAAIFGAASGSHFNPVFTIAFACDGTFPWELVPGYIVAQMLGGFVGQVLVWVLWKKHFDATKEPTPKRCCFCTAASIKCWPLNFLSEVIATFTLVFAIKGIGQVVALAGGLKWWFVFGIITAMGMGFGGLTGYALNPARDLGPRIAHAILPMKSKKEPNDWKYGLTVPILGPLVGALLGVLLYAVIPW